MVHSYSAMIIAPAPRINPESVFRRQPTHGKQSTRWGEGGGHGDEVFMKMGGLLRSSAPPPRIMPKGINRPDRAGVSRHTARRWQLPA